MCFSINCVALSNLRYTCYGGAYSVGMCAVLDTFRLGLVWAALNVFLGFEKIPGFLGLRGEIPGIPDIWNQSQERTGISWILGFSMPFLHWKLEVRNVQEFLGFCWKLRVWCISGKIHPPDTFETTHPKIWSSVGKTSPLCGPPPPTQQKRSPKALC